MSFFAPAWAAVYASAIGSIAAILSVSLALFVYLRNERRKQIDAIRVDAETARGLFDRIDRSVSSQAFLQASEEFRQRLDSLVGPNKTNESFADVLLLEDCRININRAINQSMATVNTIEHIDNNIQRFREISVRIGQAYPVSSYVLVKSLIIVERTIDLWSGGKIYGENIDDNYLKEQSEKIRSSKSPYEIELDDFCQVIYYMPLQMLRQGGQKNIDDAKFIVNSISDMISQMPLGYLRSLSKHEKSVSVSSFDSKKYVAESLEMALKANKKFFSGDQWDLLWEAKARLVASTASGGGGS